MTRSPDAASRAFAASSSSTFGIQRPVASNRPLRGRHVENAPRGTFDVRDEFAVPRMKHRHEFPLARERNQRRHRLCVQAADVDAGIRGRAKDLYVDRIACRATVSAGGGVGLGETRQDRSLQSAG